MEQLHMTWVATFRAYQRRPEHDLGEFLAHYRRSWEVANLYGVTHYEGIVRLIGLLPADWQEWAWEQSLYYTYRDRLTCALMGDLPRFLASIQSQFTVYGHPPSGPHMFVPDYPRIDVPFWDPPPEPVVTPAATGPYTGHFDAEAGPSARSHPQTPPPPPATQMAPVPPPPLDEERQAPIPADRGQDLPIRRCASASVEFARVPIQILSDIEEDSDEDDDDDDEDSDQRAEESHSSGSDTVDTAASRIFPTP